MLVGVAIFWVPACSGPALYRPPPGGSVVIAAPGPVDRGSDTPGELSLSVATPEDARPEEHRSALSSWIAEHGGHTGEAMTRDRIYRRPVVVMAGDALAEALAATGRFARVERVSSVEEAQTDLIMTSRLRRLRGWQAYRVEKDEPPRVLESLGDVFIDEIRIVERAGGRIVFIGQTGAMLEGLPDELDPYAIAQRAFDEATGALAAFVAGADLQGTLEAQVGMPSGETGDLAELPGALPAGWSGSLGSLGRPRGWSGEASCRTLRAEDSSRWFFHPRLGFYRPSIELWLCPSGWAGEVGVEGEDDRYPATLLGLGAGGETLFSLSLGKSSWPGADADLTSFFALRSAGRAPVLAVPVEERAPSMPSGLPSGPEPLGPFLP